MPEITQSHDAQAEPIRPEGDVGPRRFLVVVTEIGERIVHHQEWVTFVKPDGSKFGGYHTTAKREDVKRELFRSEFSARPIVSELAKLLEGAE